MRITCFCMLRASRKWSQIFAVPSKRAERSRTNILSSLSGWGLWLSRRASVRDAILLEMHSACWRFVMSNHSKRGECFAPHPHSCLSKWGAARFSCLRLSLCPHLYGFISVSFFDCSIFDWNIKEHTSGKFYSVHFDAYLCVGPHLAHVHNITFEHRFQVLLYESFRRKPGWRFTAGRKFRERKHACSARGQLPILWSAVR